MSQSIQPEKFVEIQDMAKAYVAELEGDENNVHVLPTMRDAAYNAYCDAYHDGFIAGASSLQGEVERLREENAIFKQGGVPDEYAKDVVINLFTDKYTKQEKFVALGALEKDKPRFEKLIQEHQPEYYSANVPEGERVMSFCIINDLQAGFKASVIRSALNK